MKKLLEWMRGRREEAAVVWVAVDAQMAAEEARGLEGLTCDDPRWRAVVLLGTRMQQELLKAAMAAEETDARDKRLSEARGVGMLLRELDGARQATARGAGDGAGKGGRA